LAFDDPAFAAVIELDQSRCTVLPLLGDVTNPRIRRGLDVTVCGDQLIVACHRIPPRVGGF
jgi:hypothetical protein